jgi:excisionase family DNA binding protein
MGDDLLTVQEVAARLRLKESTIRRMIFERRIDVIRPSQRAVRIPESAIRKIIERGYRPAVEGA